jgi:tryptophan 2,3-dioxygenase
VRPHRVLETLTLENFEHVEDFFFRSVHLGTDCWAFIATYLLKKALAKAEMHEWHSAAEFIMQASRIFNYLGDHVMMLTAMVLRDYLDLKVEIEGTSGEGSVLVKSFKSHVVALLFPLYQGVCMSDDQEMPSSIEELDSEAFLEGLVMIYSSPELYPSLYSYAKALEAIESSLLGGFYYKHFMLASNVIGSMAKGTMNKSVQALKSTYDTPCFPGIF